MRPSHRLLRGVLFLAATAVGCGGPALAPSVSAPVAPEPSASRPDPTPGATPSAAAGGTAAWPSAFAAQLVPGTTYQLSPPFDLPLTLSVPVAGWVTGHLGEEFIDLLRFEDRPLTALPARILGFALPGHVRGTTDVPASSLSPDAAVELLAGRSDVRSTNRGSITVLGVAAPTVDLHAMTPNTPLFGGPGGTFGLGPNQDARLAALEIDGRLVLVLVMADPGELDDAWAAAAPMLDSVVPGP